MRLTTLLLIASLTFASAGYAASLPEVPAKGMVTMVDLGAKSCIPCKMMAPVLVEVEKEYAGRASIIFIDVWENPQESKKYGLRAIPTQIFFDKEGKEILRHEGFFDKTSISSELDKLLVK